MCSAWSPDGQSLAFGTINGGISIRERNLDERNEIRKSAPVWCMEWTPITNEHQESYLLVGCWDRTFYYLNSEGEVREKISEKRIPFNPLSINFHSSGEFFLASGANKKISVWSRDLGFLTDVVDVRDWSWCSKFRPKSMEIAVTTNDGVIALHELSKKPIFSNYEELFATRDNLTDIVVENLLLNQKLRIRCKELIKKVSIFKEKLAVLQNDRLLIYIASEESLKYNPFRKITKQFDCESMAILNSHVVFAKDSKVQLYNLMGELEREWVFESNLTFVKALGGPPKREHLVLGLQNGQVFKIFVDNSFPIQLYKSSAAIRCCDLNLTKKKLAVVDANNNLLVIDLISQAHLYQEMGTTSCVWNSDLEDVLAYSGNGVLSIRTGTMPALTQKTEATVQGFKGFQLFVVK
jgi:intraflagellar transport protein 122